MNFFKSNDTGSNVFVVMGASGDLAKKSIYPALFYLFKAGSLPENVSIIGYARSKLTVDTLRNRVEPYFDLEDESPTGDTKSQLEQFWELNHYVAGDYSDYAKSTLLTRTLNELEADFSVTNRTFYIALPPSVYTHVTELIAKHWMPENGSGLVALEKPFGRDTESSRQLDAHLKRLFPKDNLVRVDHYLCLEMMQTIPFLRFGNPIFSSTWNKENVASVLISFKESFGTEGRGGYFDNNGIIRDVMQNHLLQILTTVAMEPPKSMAPQDVTAAKIGVLKAIQPVRMEDVVLGQYVGNPEGKLSQREGYLDDKTVPQGSKTSTFAGIVFKIDNSRWKDVPFIMVAGKALDETKDEVRIQFKEPSINPNLDIQMPKRSSLAIKVKPTEEICLLTTVKQPGLGKSEMDQAELKFKYKTHYQEKVLAGPYERLIKGLINRTEDVQFDSREELEVSWSLFTPLLEQIENENIAPFPYKFGSQGPPEMIDMLLDNNFRST